MTVGQRIQEHRKKNGLSQEELGQRLLVSRQTVSLWETDQTLPTVDNLLLLKEIFGISVDELLGEEKKETAEAEGQNTFLTKFIFMLIIALFVSLAIKTIGLLLVTALLIIPSSIARHFAKSPERMAFLSSLIGLFSVFFGMFFSFYFDIPTGPAIVISAGAFTLFSFLFKKR